MSNQHIGDYQWRLYTGGGSTIHNRGVSLPLFDKSISDDDPVHYIADKGLQDAVNVAILLGQPLLIAGEPGTGKTQLAQSIAHELNLPSPLVFHTKTTSTAKDLFYRYEALGHFHDSQFKRDAVPAENYITLEALGLAILLAMSPAVTNPYLPTTLRNKGPIRSVVLVDEIDKAPRDLPNDILDEIENMSFTVRELGKTFAANSSYRPIVVLTSNSERNLPDAFLRRCIFHYITFPDADLLREIVARRLEPDSAFTSAMLDHAIEHFMDIRDLALRKKPATAELLAWVRVLDKMEIDVFGLRPGEAEALAFTYSILAKNREDQELMTEWLK